MCCTTLYLFFCLSQPLGNCSAPTPSMLADVSKTNVVEFTKNITFHNSLHKRAHQYCRIQHQGVDSSSPFYSYRNCTGGWEQKGQTDYLEINLGYPRSVTHIGTAGNSMRLQLILRRIQIFKSYVNFCAKIGEVPMMQSFPTRRNIGRRRMQQYRAHSESQETHLLMRDGTNMQLISFIFITYLRKVQYFSLWPALIFNLLYFFRQWCSC